MMENTLFKNFTPQAIKVIVLARSEARRLGHNFVGTEQILVGLLGEKNSIASQILTSIGLTFSQVQFESQRIIGYGSGFVSEESPFTCKCRLLLNLSKEIAQQLGCNYIGTEHLLMSLSQPQQGLAAKVLENLGINLQKLRSLVIHLFFVNKFLGEVKDKSNYQGTIFAEDPFYLTKLSGADKFIQNVNIIALEQQLKIHISVPNFPQVEENTSVLNELIYYSQLYSQLACDLPESLQKIIPKLEL